MVDNDCSECGDYQDLARRRAMLWTVFVILLIMWLLGFSLHVAGGLIHLLLVVALVVLIVNLLSGRPTAV
jgi:uncharacterized membrane protein